MSVTQAFTAPGGHDAALTQRTDDLLERWPVAKLLYRMITATPLGWSTRIGLYGQWGSGKTSVLNFLQQIAEDKDDIVIRLPAWRTTGEQEFIVQFYLQLAQVLGRLGYSEPFRNWTKRQSKKGADLVGALAKKTAETELPESVNSSCFVTAWATAAGVAAEKLSDILQLDSSDIEALRKELGHRRVIVFIDDLDRADPQVLPQTLLALRELLDWPGFVFVLAFDKEVVGKALRSYSEAFGESAQHFLDKIIDVPVTLPEPTPKQVQRMVKKNLRYCCPFLPDAAIEQTAEWFPANPRQAKRICRSLSVFGAAADRHAENELDWRGIILQTVLRETEPKVAQVVEASMLGFLSAWRPLMFNKNLSAEQGRQKQDALQVAQCSEDELRRERLSQLVDELGEARSKLSLETINYEMSLAVREVEFTLPEFSRFLQSWLEHRSSRPVEDFIQTSASRSDAGERVVAGTMLNVANMQYGQLLGRAPSIHSREELERMLRDASELLALIEFFYSVATIAALATARSGYEVCQGFIQTFLRLSVQQGSQSERGLRERELKLVRLIAAECDDSKRLYLDVEPHHGTVFPLPWHGSQAAYQDYVHALREATAPRLVEETINLFRTPNGVTNVFIQDDAKFNWILTSEKSPLYWGATKEQGCAVFKALIQDSQDLDSRATLAKNALSYLGLFISLSENNPEPLIAYRAALHGQYIEIAWEAISQLEPTIQTLVYLKVVKTQLDDLVEDPELLSTPEWWDGRHGDIEYELQGL